MTTDIIQNIYDNQIPVELFVEVHEFGGIYLEEKGFPGMNIEELKNVMSNIIISQDLDLSKGWWASEYKETEEAFKERVKKVFAKLKTLAAANEEDYTICIVTHNLFLNAFFTILINAEFLVGSN
jgi:broad specificity phosphatase PhoE